MNPKKKRSKNRRRARRLADQAWDAAENCNFDLAAKIIRRAVALNPGNPVLWNDQGLLLCQSGDDDDAAASFEAAITLSPNFAQAYANLADVRARQGRTDQSVVLQREAVRHAPESTHYREKLTAYEALVGHGVSSRATRADPERHLTRADAVTDESLRIEYPALASSIDRLDWSVIEAELTHGGFSYLPEFLSPQQSAILREMFTDDRRFSRTVTMAKRGFGKGVYRYFGAPIPRCVDAIRRFVYPHVARIANAWQRLLREDTLYPLTWAEFRNRCAQVGQTTPSPLLLKYEKGGFNAFHRDIRGDVYFPLQLLIVLSSRFESSVDANHGFTGGDFLVADCPERDESDWHRIPAGYGDAVLFCTRARPVSVAGVYGLKSVKHGMDRLESGTRFAIGIPFHEFTSPPASG